MWKKIIYVVFLALLSVNLRANKILDLNTDKAQYKPKEDVNFSLQLESYTVRSKVCISIYLLDSIVKRDTIKNITNNKISYRWTPPNYNYNGLLVVFEHRNDSAAFDIQTIAVDISYDWTRYPRYGFLSKYNSSDTANIATVIKKLNRYHLNGIQFYDWQNKHHAPLPVDLNGNPLSAWVDIANNQVSFNTVKLYVDACHQHGMNAMSYNLLYGAWKDAWQEDVGDTWYLFKDAMHNNMDFLSLPSGWQSNIFLLNPANVAWQEYLTNKTNFALSKLGFDGFHVDQVGDRGAVYDYNGQRVLLDQTFRPFLNYSKNKLARPHVMNAVDQFGQAEIAKSPVDFLYSEVWTFNSNRLTFNGLNNVIIENNAYAKAASKKLSTVIAGYINYNLNGGYFNIASVLFADAVIFSNGGSHLELGEHMLHKEYFPNADVAMSQNLQNRLVKYYDFATAYERVLCNDNPLQTPDVTSLNSAVNIQPFPASIGAIAVSKRNTEKGTVYHFINFTKAAHLNWRDDNGTQAIPDTLTNVEMKIKIDPGQVFQKVWVASPDGSGIPKQVNYTIENGYIRVIVPQINYWTMLVMDNGTWLSVNEFDEKNNIDNIKCYPNPFKDNLYVQMGPKYNGNLKSNFTLYNSMGMKISEGEVSNPNTEIMTKELNSGTYFVIVTNKNGTIGKKVLTCVK